MRLGVGAIGGFFSPSEPLGPPTGVIIKREWAPALQRSAFVSARPQEAPGIRGRPPCAQVVARSSQSWVAVPRAAGLSPQTHACGYIADN